MQKADETNAEIERRGWSDEAPTISEAERVPLYHEIYIYIRFCKMIRSPPSMIIGQAVTVIAIVLTYVKYRRNSRAHAL